MRRLIDASRAIAFYVGYSLATMVWGSLSVLIAWTLPYRARFRFVIVWWTRFVLFWLRLCCGITHRIEGRENIPRTPCIVFVKHESTWETLFIQSLFAPQATLVKRELLHIPFFGWAFRLLKPIAINRNDPRSALRTLIRTGRARLDAGIWVVLFPEGTRVPLGTTGEFQLGGAALAEATGAPLLVVAHNAGTFWPAHRLLKHPGVIEVKISEPIPTVGKKSREINRLARDTLLAVAGPSNGQTSRLTTDNALDSMNTRLGST